MLFSKIRQNTGIKMGSRVGAIGAQWVETLAAVSNGLNLLPRTHRVVFFWPPHVCTVASMHPWKQQGVGRRKRKKKEKVNIKMQFLKWDIYFPPNSSNKQLLVPTIFSKLPSSHAAHPARKRYSTVVSIMDSEPRGPTFNCQISPL